MKPTEGDFIDGPRDTGLNEAKPPEALLSHIQNNSNRHKNPHDHNYNSQNHIQVIFNFYTNNERNIRSSFGQKYKASNVNACIYG